MRQKTAFTLTTWVILGVFLALPATAGEMGEMMANNLAGVEEKLVGLAKAMPDDKFGWSPAEGVRTVSEAFMHVAGANYFFASKMGVDMPEGTRGLEKTVKDKAGVIKQLEASFANIKKGLKGADMSQATKLFGGKEGTIGDLALIAVGHGHEHLGQVIAYARSNGVKPPWSK